MNKTITPADTSRAAQILSQMSWNYGLGALNEAELADLAEWARHPDEDYKPFGDLQEFVVKPFEQLPEEEIRALAFAAYLVIS